MKTYRIGIDVGGTNTDCVLVDANHQIVAKTKQPTTSDVTSGISNALKQVITDADVNPSSISKVMLGTTHCTNALVERKGLNKVGVIRICKPAAQAIPPLMSLPEDLTRELGNQVHLVHGGYEFDGRLIHSLITEEIEDVLKQLNGKVDTVAVTGIFSKINPDQELQVKELAHKILGEETIVSLSHEIGSLGLLERENATILNAALSGIATNVTSSLTEAVKAHGIAAQLYIGQNDGTLMTLESAKRFPVLTIASGPTNSIRGAGALSGVKNGIVIDVGGTTSDAGVLVNQFPRESAIAANVGGVKTNFRMPDVVAIGLGGGTIITHEDEGLKIGPESVGYRIKEKALAFGGNTYTLSDYALLEERFEIAGSLPKNALALKISEKLNQEIEPVRNSVANDIKDKINYLVDKVKTDAKPVPVVLVGGGAPILPDEIEGVSKVIVPDHYEVANAFGACIAQVSGEMERVFNLATCSREEAIEQVKKEATQNAIVAGADENTIEILTVSDTPLPYLPNAIKVQVKVCGELG